MSARKRGGKYPPGLLPRGRKIQMTFMYLGERRRELVPFAPTTDGFRKAETMRAIVLQEIGLGTFDYAHHFPHSSYVVRKTCDAQFQTFVAQYLEFGDHAKSTAISNVRNANKHVIPALGQRAIADITATELLAWRTSLLETLSPKSVNNIMIIVRQAFALAVADGKITTNPASAIKNLKLRRSASMADPFSLDEIALLRAHAGEEWLTNLIDVWWGSGVRTGELIALRWEHVDDFNDQIDIHISHVAGDTLIPKDQEHRTIAMFSIAKDALARQRKITGKAAHGFVFVDPETDEPFLDSKELADYLKPLIERSGVRYRRQYNLRHSFASYALSAGEPALAIRDQLGHETMEMLEKHYSKSMLQRNRRQWNGFEDVIRDARAKFAATIRRD